MNINHCALINLSLPPSSLSSLVDANLPYHPYLWCTRLDLMKIVMLYLLVFKMPKHPCSFLHKLRQFLTKIFISSTNSQFKMNIQLRTFYAIYINLSIRPYVISSNNTR